MWSRSVSRPLRRWWRSKLCCLFRSIDVWCWETAGVFPILSASCNGVLGDVQEIKTVLSFNFDVIEMILKFTCSVYNEV